MKEQLTNILSNVNDWLKFAEAKNAALIAFDGACIFGIMQTIQANQNDDYLFYKGLIMALMCIAICVSIFSFLPALTRTFKYDKYDDSKFEQEKEKLNCYFFKHHSKINCKQLIQLLNLKSSSSNGSASPLDLDLADQIINNAEIALSKFRLFSVAGYITFAAVLLGLGILFFNLF